MKKVIFIIGTLSSGGAERVVSNISMNLRKDIEREIILFGDNAKIDYMYEGKVTYLDRDNPTNPLSKFKTLIKRLIKLREIKKRNQKTAIISLLEYPNLLNLLSGYHENSIVSVRNFMSNKHKRGLKAFLWNLTIKMLYGKARKIIVVSKEMKKDLITNYKLPEEKITVIYNSYPLSEIESYSNEKLSDKENEIFSNPTIITVGRLSKQKGHWHLIRAFKRVKDKVPNVKLVIIGEGGLKNELVKLSQELRLDNDIHFLGFKPNPFKYIANSNIFVLSSLYEGFPNVLAEAMACGTSVVSSDCLSGPREILAPEEYEKQKLNYDINKKRYGVLVPVCDGVKRSPCDSLTNEEIILADRLITILENKHLQDYFSKKSIQRIKDFEIKKIIKEWENIITIN